MARLILLLLLAPITLLAQKNIYIPLEWQQGSLDYSLDRSTQSDNFVIFWGPLAGTDPTQAPADISFDPASILATAEELYKFYIDTIQFVNDETGLLSQYKIILVMLHTWTGVEGWAFGGNYDGKVGAMWMHPHAASSGPTLAHEFTHTLQNYTWMLNPGHGFIDSSYVGFFWETHAEFMSLQKYPSVALDFDMARWLNTNQFHWSSTRHHYQAFVFLQFIKELDGIIMINRMWNESIIGEHPLETYKRLKDISQEELNDLFAQYAMQNVTWDYEIGDLLRERISTLEKKFVAHPTIIPDVVNESKEWYRIPNHLAPQDYGYNIIRIYPKQNAGCTKNWVSIHLEEHWLSPGYDEQGLRYGMVAVNGLGIPRYTEVLDAGTEFLFEMESDEVELYLVVSGAPKIHHNYAWEIGFPKIYRYPYDFRVENGWPEGYQPGYRAAPAVPGAPHANGGGFVAATATVAPSAYVGPDALVLDHARVLDYARVEDHAIIQDAAVVRQNAVVRDHALVAEDAGIYGNAMVEKYAHVNGGCEIYDNALITGSTLIFLTSTYENAVLKDNTFCWGANLHGDVVLGGDAEFFSECDNGTYLQFEGAYNRNCDGLDDHPANIDVTTQFIPPTITNNFSIVCDEYHENEFLETFEYICEGDSLLFYGIYLTQPGVYDTTFGLANGADAIHTLFLELYNNPDIHLTPVTICEGDSVVIEGQVFYHQGDHVVYFDFGCALDSAILHLSLTIIDTTVEAIDNGLTALAQDVIFQWYDCTSDKPVSGAVQRNFTPSQAGFYKVRLTTIKGCEAFSSCQYISTTAIEYPYLDFEWRLTPNPAQDFIDLVVKAIPSSGFEVEVSNQMGQVVIRNYYSTASLEEMIDISHLASGTYTLRLKGDGWISREGRFVKMK